jgi:hypothetical protein
VLEPEPRHEAAPAYVLHVQYRFKKNVTGQPFYFVHLQAKSYGQRTKYIKKHCITMCGKFKKYFCKLYNINVAKAASIFCPELYSRCRNNILYCSSATLFQPVLRSCRIFMLLWLRVKNNFFKITKVNIRIETVHFYDFQWLKVCRYE